MIVHTTQDSILIYAISVAHTIYATEDCFTGPNRLPKKGFDNYFHQNYICISMRPNSACL